MTLIVGVWNKNALAFAADSIGSVWHKTFIVNKLFELSDNDPIWVAVAWSSDFMNMQLETILKEFKKNIVSTNKDTLPEYVDLFFDYLKDSTYINHINYEILIREVVLILIWDIKNTVDENIAIWINDPELLTKTLEEKSGIIAEKVKKLVWDCLNKLLNVLQNHNSQLMGLENIEENIDNILSVINSQQDELDNLFCSKGSSNLQTFIKVAILSLNKDLIFKSHINNSLLIFFGFWKTDFIPRVQAINLYQKLENSIIYSKAEDIVIDDGFIEPYAQWEDVLTSILSIGDETVYKIKKNLEKSLQNLDKNSILNKKQIDIVQQAVQETLKTVRVQSHLSLIEAVRFLSKAELWKIAESLVGIGSMKKRMNMWYETIWGPIDVAIVTKSDWFIRIKRKYYFDPSLNYHYFNRLIWKNERSNIPE